MSASAVGPARGVKIDIFPARVECEMGALPISRARVTSDARLMVWAENTQWNHTPILVVDAPIDTIVANTISTAPQRKAQLVIMTEDRRVFTIKRRSGCGCGSRLKSPSQLPQFLAPQRVRDEAFKPESQPSDIEQVLHQHFPKLATGG